MAISVIGQSTSNITGPIGTSTYISGYCSTGSYTMNLPEGRYAIQTTGSYGNITLADGSIYYGNTTNALNGSYGDLNAANEFYCGAQSATVYTGMQSPYITRNLGFRANGNSFWNRNKINYINSKYVFTGGNFTTYSSSDAMTWSPNTITFQVGACFTLANNILFAGDVNFTNTFYYSTNGTTFTQLTFPTTTIADAKLHAVVYVGTTYVAFVRRSNVNSYAVHTFTSTNGTTWTYGGLVSNTGIFSAADIQIFVASSGTNIVTTGDGNNNLNSSLIFALYSSNGTTWTSTTFNNGAASSYFGPIEYVNGNFVTVVGTANSYYTIAYSTLGTTSWSSRVTTSTEGFITSQQPPNTVNGISWDGTRYIFSIYNLSSPYYGIFYTTSLSSALTPATELYAAQQAVNGSRYTYYSAYINSKYFYVLYDGVLNSPMLHISTTPPPIFTAPSSFTLFKYADSKVLN